MIKKVLLIISITLLMYTTGFSQISSPGLGKTKTASWMALGVRQDLDTMHRWQSVTYVGMGRKSNPDNWDPLRKRAILVFNQEFYHRLNEHWQNSFALSYRRQDEYTKDAPYQRNTPDIQQEFRIYSRISYTLKSSKFKFVPTFRQEFRKFYAPHFASLPENFQFRSRMRLQLTYYLNAKQSRKLILGDEQIFSISKESASNAWTGFNYQESRFSLYYSVSPEHVPFTFSVGYMNNLVGIKNPYAAHYLAFDVIFENPFKRHHPKKHLHENVE
jgi:hypothetical protein